MKEKKCHGLTIVEMVVSFALLLIAAVVVLGLLPLAMRTNRNTRMESEALYLAQMMMDDTLRGRTGGTVISTQSSLEPVSKTINVTNADRDTANEVTAFSWMRVGSADPGLDPNLEFITVTVVWTDNNTTRSVALYSSVPKSGLSGL